MLKDNSIYVNHILEQAEKILVYVEGMTENDFLKDEKTQSAVIREFQVIGEASKKISDDFKKEHDVIPWKTMSGMRDILIHNYEGVNPLTLWDTIEKDIPELIHELKQIIN